MLNRASASDFDLVMSIFRHHKDYFPHIRHDKIWQYINSGNVILEDDVVITYRKYQKRTQLGECYAEKGHVIINQIASLREGEGKGKKVLKQFLKEFDSTVWLTVRFDNYHAINFYFMNSFYAVGHIAWKDDTIDGVVMNSMPNRATLDLFMID